MMAKRIGDSNCWVRIFEVSEPTRHRKGFTVYKVISTVFPKAFPESATKIVVWKRYSDFRKLHKELEQIFKQLYLKGEFPEFPKTKLFGRFEHEVVEERRNAALVLLEFTANHTQLFTSKAFIQFFENGYSSQDFIGRILFSKGDKEQYPPTGVFAEKSEISAPCLEPQKVWSAARNSLNDEDCLSMSASSMSSSLSPEHPEAPITENGCDPSPNLMPRSSISSDLVSVSFSVNSQVSENGNSSVLSSKPDVDSDSKLKVRTDSSTTDSPWAVKTSHDRLSDEPSTSNMNSTPRAGGIVRSATVTDDLSSYFDEEFEDAAFLFPAGSCSSLNTLPGYTPSTDSQDSSQSNKPSSHSSRGLFSLPRKKPLGFGFFDFLPLFPKKSKKKQEKEEKQKEEAKKEKGEMLSVGYICEAAGHFAVAQFHESNTDYGDAFAAYKEGIRVLLAGAQDDTDRERKVLARNKLEKYLSRAESLKDSFLSPGTSTGNGAISPVFSSPNKRDKCLSALNNSGKSLSMQSNGRTLFSSLEELKLYKVVGLGPARSTILVVMNPNEEAPKCYAAKVLWKSPCVVYPDKPNIVPGRVPFMVKLEKWFDTPDKIILLLEHAGGGRLIDFVKNYQSKRISFVSPPDVDTPSDGNRSPGFDGVLNELLKNAVPPEQESNTGEEASLDTAVSQLDRDNTLPCMLDERPEISVSDSDNDPALSERLEVSTPFLTPPEEDHEHRETSPIPDSSTPETEISRLLKNSKALLQTVSKTLEEGKAKKIEKVEPLPEPDTESGASAIVSEVPTGADQTSVTPTVSEEPKNDEDPSTVNPLPECGQSHSEKSPDEEEGCATPVRMKPEGCIKVWAAEIIIALEALHDAGITYGNLSINDILLGENGHILLRYKSLWKDIDDPVQCNHYMAPEVLDSIGIPLWKMHPSADWWSIGAILFLLITGLSFESAHPEGVFPDMVIKVPESGITGNSVSRSAHTLLMELLQHSPEIRLGYYGAAEIKTHPFFEGFDWDKAAEDCAAED